MDKQFNLKYMFINTYRFIHIIDYYQFIKVDITYKNDII